MVHSVQFDTIPSAIQCVRVGGKLRHSIKGSGTCSGLGDISEFCTVGCFGLECKCSYTDYYYFKELHVTDQTLTEKYFYS